MWQFSFQPIHQATSQSTVVAERSLSACRILEEEEDEEDSAEIEFLEHKLDEDIHPTRAAYLHD